MQVDGKLRDRLTVAAGLSEKDSENAALASEKVKAAIGGRKITRVVVVPDRIVSIVTGS